MKTPLRVLVYTVVVAAVFLAGATLKTLVIPKMEEAAVPETVSAQAMDSIAAPAQAAAEPDAGSPPAPIDDGADLKRGSFFTEEIRAQVGQPGAAATVQGVTVSLSNVVRQDTRAFVTVCMQQAGSREPLDFGAAYLDYPDGRASNFFVHDGDRAPDGARCLVMEFVGIPPAAASQGWQFTLEWVGYQAPQEGSECSAYARRGQESAALQQAGIAFTCEVAAGQAQIHVTARPDGLSEDAALALIDQAFAGVVNGPWVFSPAVE